MLNWHIDVLQCDYHVVLTDTSVTSHSDHFFVRGENSEDLVF